MNLKPVAAAFLALGLASSSAFAAKAAQQNNGHHHHVVRHRHLLHDYVNSEYYVFYNNASSPVHAHHWTRRIHLSGLVNVDYKYQSRGPLGIVPLFVMSDDSHELNVNNANIFVDAHINPCVTAHIGLAYVMDSVNNFDLGLRTSNLFNEFTKQIRSDRSSVFAGGELSVDEAYITIGDFATTPIYFRAGKMYTQFGSYTDPYPITYSFPQLFSQLRATTVELGYVNSCGLYGSVYMFDGAVSGLNFSDEKFNDKLFKNGEPSSGSKKSLFANEQIPYTRVNNWGVKVGWHGCTDCFDYHVNGAWIKDIRDVNYFADIQDLFWLTFRSDDKKAELSEASGFGLRQTGGFSLHGDVCFGRWNLRFDYVSALRNMVRHPHLEYEEDDLDNGAVTSTRPWATDLAACYHCAFWGYPSYVLLSWQNTGQANGIAPEHRIQGQVSAEIYPHTHLTFEYTNNRDYDKGDSDGFCSFVNAHASKKKDETGIVCGGTDHSTNQAALRLAVEF